MVSKCANARLSELQKFSTPVLDCLIYAMRPIEHLGSIISGTGLYASQMYVPSVQTQTRFSMIGIGLALPRGGSGPNSQASK